MQNVLAVARREFNSYINSPIAYIVVTVYFITAGWLFFTELFLENQADMRAFFGLAPLLFSLIMPFLTMRLLAEERAQGTLELLLSMPVTDWEVVLGKYLASLGLIGLLIGLTVAFPVTVAALGPLDKGATLAAYVGMLSMCGTYAAIGLMASAFSRNQIIAALIAFAIGFGLFIVGQLVQVLPPSIAPLANALSIHSRFQNIARGVIDTRDVVYYASMIGTCLLVTQATLESRRWR